MEPFQGRNIAPRALEHRTIERAPATPIFWAAGLRFAMSQFSSSRGNEFPSTRVPKTGKRLEDQIRRGRGADLLKIGGACDCAATKRVDESKPTDLTNLGNTARTTSKWGTVCDARGCTKVECCEDMFLQHSWLAYPPDIQRMEPQHRMACSGVVMARQSEA